ncbi:MAG: putative 2-dehydropantoate 2-reductase [Drouetiella hepatica Uher 2000/2452]|jgi:2-dehydropantoate 2-reductase|uniref:2-dehydropantoate 2-reductase n=1 Tax=Drouetiella hepatica Uher 2000/2452 TaxID=904376 RepID=A0A951QCV1_9CYAN|nr:putative 2-dehydropantoate 2-reductase [Drouetiella hepatica Uher 2000/2452]
MITFQSLQNPRTYAILGTGALGGFYGARLQQAGIEVHFLLRSDYEQVRQQGLTLESPDGNVTLPQVYAYRNVCDMPPCDVVIVALKTTQNHLLPDLLPPVLKDNGVVLVLQNGLGIEVEVAKIVGSDRVVGGLCFLCSNKIAPGHIRHLDYKQITLGDYGIETNGESYSPCGVTERMQQIATDFERAGIPIDCAEDLFIARWKKLVWNIPFNGLSVVLNATTHEMMADDQTRTLAEKLMEEVVLGAAACVRAIDPSSTRAVPPHFIQTMLEYTAKMTPYRTSMKLDYDDRRPLETEAILGNPLRMAKQAGVELPRIEMLYQQLKFLGARNQV